jgi:Protein of unknown function (DUF2934)
MTPEKAAGLAANLLILAFKDATLDDGSISVGLEQGSTHLAKSEKHYLLKSGGMMATKKAARKLVPLLDFYPLEQCIQRLTTVVIELKDTGTPLANAHEGIRKQVLQFLQTFSTQGQWEVVHAVRGINPSECSFTLGTCHFYVMDDDQFSLWGRRMATGRYDPPNNAPLFQSWFQQEAALRGQVVAAVKVRATDHEHARAKGRSRIGEVLNVLRYAQLVIGFPEKPFPELGVAVQQWWEDHSIVIQLDKPNFGTRKAGSGHVGIPISISRQAPGWNGLEQLVRLELSARSELQLRMTTALEWIGQAAAAPNPPIRLVGLVTAWEALLIEESETLGKKRKLANRVSRLIAKADAEQQRVFQEIEELYEGRSECIHAGLLDVEKDSLAKAIQLVAKTVDGLLNREPFHRMSCLEDVLKVIEPLPKASSPEMCRRWIAENAYYRWLGGGHPSGRDVQHWLEAEKEYLNLTTAPISISTT